ERMQGMVSSCDWYHNAVRMCSICAVLSLSMGSFLPRSGLRCLERDSESFRIGDDDCLAEAELLQVVHARSANGDESSHRPFQRDRPGRQVQTLDCGYYLEGAQRPTRRRGIFRRASRARDNDERLLLLFLR